MMRVKIRRASSWADPETPPVPNATWEESKVVDARAFKSFADYDSMLGKHGKWLSRGENHRVTKGGIARDLKEHSWVLDVPDVWAFVREHGRSVVAIDEGIAEITIYDDYLE